MNTIDYKYEVLPSGDGTTVFNLISSTGACIGKILYSQKEGRIGCIYKISRLGTANGGKGLDEIGLTGIEISNERIPGLLYIMFKLFIDYIQKVDMKDSFSINIEKPLHTLEGIYRKLYLHLYKNSYIDSGVVNKDFVILKCGEER